MCGEPPSGGRFQRWTEQGLRCIARERLQEKSGALFCVRDRSSKTSKPAFIAAGVSKDVPSVGELLEEEHDPRITVDAEVAQDFDRVLQFVALRGHRFDLRSAQVEFTFSSRLGPASPTVCTRHATTPCPHRPSYTYTSPLVPLMASISRRTVVDRSVACLMNWAIVACSERTRVMKSCSSAAALRATKIIATIRIVADLWAMAPPCRYQRRPGEKPLIEVVGRRRRRYATGVQPNSS